MDEMIKSMEDGRLFIELKKEIFDKEAITLTTYKFTDACYIGVDLSSSGNFKVSFKAKDKQSNLEEIIDKFCNELIDQQVRVETQQEFGKIKEEIVRKAFSPIDR